MITPNIIIQKLEEVMNNNCRYNRGTLEENSANSKCTNVSFELNGQRLIYKFDTSAVFPYFSNGTQNALADYFIFSPHISDNDVRDNHLFVFICNLKSDHTSNTHDQVHAGYIFVRFLLETVCRLLKQREIPNFVQFRAIHLGTGPQFPKSNTNTKSLAYKTYENGLPYIFSSCQNTLKLNHLKKIPIS